MHIIADFIAILFLKQDVFFPTVDLDFAEALLLLLKKNDLSGAGGAAGVGGEKRGRPMAVAFVDAMGGGALLRVDKRVTGLTGGGDGDVLHV